MPRPPEVDEADYRCHRIRLTRSPLMWFAYVYPPSGRRALDRVLTATLVEGRGEALRRACSMIDAQDRVQIR
jgi:hypothetical protein